MLVQHIDWIKSLVTEHGNQHNKDEAIQLVQHKVGTKFVDILGHAGVYKRTEAGQQAFKLFLQHLGYKQS
jgi:UDPglucose--hexose-1-phosphate uridylyltransferase